MSQQEDSPRSQEDDWWRQLYDDGAAEASMTPDSVDAHFDSALDAVTPPAPPPPAADTLRLRRPTPPPPPGSWPRPTRTPAVPLPREEAREAAPEEGPEDRAPEPPPADAPSAAAVWDSWSTPAPASTEEEREPEAAPEREQEREPEAWDAWSSRPTFTEPAEAVDPSALASASAEEAGSWWSRPKPAAEPPVDVWSAPPTFPTPDPVRPAEPPSEDPPWPRTAWSPPPPDPRTADEAPEPQPEPEPEPPARNPAPGPVSPPPWFAGPQAPEPEPEPAPAPARPWSDEPAGIEPQATDGPPAQPWPDESADVEPEQPEQGAAPWWAGEPAGVEPQVLPARPAAEVEPAADDRLPVPPWSVEPQVPEAAEPEPPARSPAPAPPASAEPQTAEAAEPRAEPEPPVPGPVAAPPASVVPRVAEAAPAADIQRPVGDRPAAQPWSGEPEMLPARSAAEAEPAQPGGPGVAPGAVSAPWWAGEPAGVEPQAAEVAEPRAEPEPPAPGPVSAPPGFVGPQVPEARSAPSEPAAAQPQVPEADVTDGPSAQPRADGSPMAEAAAPVPAVEAGPGRSWGEPAPVRPWAGGPRSADTPPAGPAGTVQPWAGGSGSVEAPSAGLGGTVQPLAAEAPSAEGAGSPQQPWVGRAAAPRGGEAWGETGFAEGDVRWAPELPPGWVAAAAEVEEVGGPEVVGGGPPTYAAEPTAWPEAAPDDLAALVADTVLDGAHYGTMTLRTVSVRGDSARYRGHPRRDALLTARFGAGDDALLLVAMASGARAADDAHRASQDAVKWIAGAVGRSRTRLSDDLRAARRGSLKSGLHRLTDRCYGRLRARGEDLGLAEGTYTASLRCLLLSADPECRIRLFFGVGDGGLFRIRDDTWQDLDLAPDDTAAPFRFRATVARPGDALVMCSGGLAEPLRGEPELAAHLAARWGAGPPGMAGYLADAQTRVKGYADDRTAVTVWDA